MGEIILVVEDDRDIRRNMQRLLEDEGYEVHVAENGQEALALLERAPALPQLILLDLMMPVMDGFQFREAQLKSAKFAGIPVVIVTADGHPDEKKTRTQAVAALRKPADIVTILETVERFVKSA